MRKGEWGRNGNKIGDKLESFCLLRLPFIPPIQSAPENVTDIQHILSGNNPSLDKPAKQDYIIY